ncbi:MAG: T9SS type A sorting domain-containing protein [Chloroherpetonaceae bacterium]
MANSITLFSQINLQPINLNYYEIKVIGNDFYLLADKGNMSKYNMDTKELQLLRLFSSGKILNFLEIENIFYAFSENGEVAYSTDKGNTWNIKKINNNKLLAAVQIDSTFCLRDSNNVFLLDKNFNLINKFKLNSPRLVSINIQLDLLPDYRYSICSFKNNIVVETDSSKLLIFNKQLQFLDSLEIMKTAAYDTTFRYRAGYKLLTDSFNLYIKMYQNTYNYNPYESIYKTEDLKNVTLFKQYNSHTIYNKIINNKLEEVDFQNKAFIDTNLLSFTYNMQDFYTKPYFSLLKDFTIKNNKIYIVGNGGIFESLNIEDSSLTVINENYWNSGRQSPIILNDSSAIFLSGNNFFYETYILPYFYLTTDRGKTFKSTVRRNYPGNSDTLIHTRFYLMNYDTLNMEFYLIGVKDYPQSKSSIFISKDTLKSFTIIDTETQFNTEFSLLNQCKNLDFRSLRIKENKELIYFVEPHRTSPYKVVFTSFRVIDHNYNEYFQFIDTNYAMDYVFLKDTNNFVLHCANMLDSARSEIRLTTDRGASWEFIHKYEISDTILNTYDIKLKNKNYLVLFHINRTLGDTLIYMDVYAPEENIWKRLKTWNLKSFNLSYINNVPFTSNNEIAVLSIKDTLFYIADFDDSTKWKYRILPNNGKLNGKITIWDKDIVGTYSDDLNQSNYSIISFSDTTLLSVQDYAVEKGDYLYSYPPYPNPATSEVRAKIFWDMSLNINNADIKVYDIYGKEVSNKNAIEVIPESDWSGILKWNCSSVDPGAYLIVINYGTQKKVIKVMKI